MGFCSVCGTERLENENFCRNCRDNINQNSSAQPLPRKRSNLWYLAPIFFSIIGGIIAFAVLRKSDSSKAKKCLVIGIGLFIIWTAISMAAANNENAAEINNKVNSKIEAPDTSSKIITKETIPAPKPATVPKSEPSNTIKYDPKIVAAAKQYIPDMQALPLEILKQCRAIDSRTDYNNFLLVVALLEEDLSDLIVDMGEAMTILELSGYDDHPEVGPLIKETRKIALDAGFCITDKMSRYG